MFLYFLFYSIFYVNLTFYLFLPGVFLPVLHVLWQVDETMFRHECKRCFFKSREVFAPLFWLEWLEDRGVPERTSSTSLWRSPADERGGHVRSCEVTALRPVLVNIRDNLFLSKKRRENTPVSHWNRAAGWVCVTTVKVCVRNRVNMASMLGEELPHVVHGNSENNLWWQQDATFIIVPPRTPSSQLHTFLPAACRTAEVSKLNKAARGGAVVVRGGEAVGSWAAFGSHQCHMKAQIRKRGGFFSRKERQNRLCISGFCLPQNGPGSGFRFPQTKGLTQNE